MALRCGGDTARGSTVTAGNNINITVTGAGVDSNLLIQGSDVKAGNNTNLTADNQINLQAAKNEASQTSTNSFSSGSDSVSYGAGGWGGGASAPKGSGKSAGQDTSYTNTQIAAGNTVIIKSGGDTTIKGAVVAANRIAADIGGNLNIESLKDTSTYTSNQKSVSASVSVGGGAVTGGSVGASRSKVNSDLQSVGEQSGLKAGDGGFQVNVGGNTDLKGSVIASTQTAVDANKNTFTSAGPVTITDLQNVASFKASGVSVGVSVGMLSPGSPLTPGGSAGFGSAGGNASSTSSAGISGIAGNTAVRTGDANTGLTRIFDADKVLREINAQVAITAAFSKEAPKAVATFSANQMADLKKDLAKETDPDKHAAIRAEIDRWDEGGRYRVLLHTLAGAFSGGASGAAGAAASASAAPLMNQLQDGIANGLQTAGLSADVAKGIASGVAGLTAAGAGAAVGGAAGAATAFTVDVNNRQLHPTERQRIKELASLKAKETCKGSADCERSAALYWADMLQSAAEGRIDNDKAKQNTAYYNQIVNAAGIVGSEASVTGASVNYFNDLKSAQQLLNADAGKPIFMANGQVQLGSDGKPQTYFGATEAQKADAYGNMFPGGSPNTTSAVIAGKAQRDQDRLVRLTALNGSAKPDTTLEEILFGVRLPVRGVGAVVQVTERSTASALVGTAKAAEEALLRSGGAFDKAGKPLLDMSALTNNQKGAIGELFGVKTATLIVPDGQKIARMQGVGTNGIDDLYKVNRPDVDYVFIEYKFVGQDGKTGAQLLGKTQDGVQGSEGWLTGSNRISNAVGLDQSRDVFNALRANRTESWVITTRPDGSTFVQVLDAAGKPKPIDTSKIVLPNVNLSGAKP